MAPIGENEHGDENRNNEASPCHDTDSDQSRDCRRDQSISQATFRSSSSSRSRSRHRHRHHRRRSRFRFKRKETNFYAAVCSMIVLVLLCTALAEPEWFIIKGGGCRDYNDIPVHKLGISEFFYLGHFTEPKSGGTKPVPESIYSYGTSANEILKDCVTIQIVSIMKSIVSLCFFAIVFSLVAFLLDLSGPTHRLLKFVRRNGICNILTVVVCVVINGFSYWATESIEKFQQATKQHPGSKADVQFSISFYLVTAAGSMSVIATACNLLKRPAPHDNDPEQRDNLLLDYDGMDYQPGGHDPIARDLMMNVPPPPPYTP